MNLPEIKKQTVDLVESRIKTLHSRGEIDFPATYSPANALKSAWLVLQNTQDRNKKPVLETCNKISIMNALFDMTVQGLNPAKKQVYFIAYGDKLAAQRSYHGTMAVAKMVDPTIAEINAQVIWEGDDFEFEINRGKKFVVRHKQTLNSIDSKKPAGGYCEIIDVRGEVKSTTIMTWDQIKSAWKKSQTNPVMDSGQIKAGSVHFEFMEEMVKKTVINRACKPIINSSSDATLLGAVTRSEQERAEYEADAEAEANANAIDVDVEEVRSPAPAPEPEEVDPEVNSPEEPEWLKREIPPTPDF